MSIELKATIIFIILFLVAMLLPFTCSDSNNVNNTYTHEETKEEKRCNFVGSSINLSGNCGYGVHVTPNGIKFGYSYF